MCNDCFHRSIGKGCNTSCTDSDTSDTDEESSSTEDEDESHSENPHK